MYTAKDFSHLLGLEGLSDTLLSNHFTLYQGYVTNTNKLTELLAQKEVGTPEYAELHRRFGWEWNGMRLYELYFDNLVQGGVALEDNNLKQKIEAIWGSYENWEKEWRGMAAMRGVGWVILSYDKNNDKLINTWIAEHDGGHLAGLATLLVMDVWEHAFMLDYGIKRADYINVFMKAVNWHVAHERM